MNGDSSLIPFGRYMRLYTLHQVESTPSHTLLLYVRIMTLRYSFAPLVDLPLDAAYADDPRGGADLVRRAVLPRLHTLLDTDDPWRALTPGTGQAALWDRYAAERGLPAGPVRVPAVRAPANVPYLPARSEWGERMARTERALGMLQTAAETASTLAALWQNWQIGRERRKLLETQRLLLHDAIQAQLAGQGVALDRSGDRGFVRGYLAAHGGDEAYDAVFGAEDAPAPSA